MTERLFPIEDVPEVPILRAPRRSRGELDARFRNDYPPEWDRCGLCGGSGLDPISLPPRAELPCPRCLGMGSVKAMVRFQAGFRCLRCKHPYVPKGDAEKIQVEPSWRDDGWSACDDRCEHGMPARCEAHPFSSLGVNTTTGGLIRDAQAQGVDRIIEAQWRILTVHHADGDKANLAWWNLLALCQRCHLEIQAKVVMERVYPHEHTDWFKPFVAGYYAQVYLGETLTRQQVEDRLDELLGLELAAA
jgi:hypothetical protein